MNRKQLLLVILVVLLIFLSLDYFYKINKKELIVVSPKIEITKKFEPEKLNDDSLLIQINKQHCLPADYVPQDLVNIANYEIPADGSFRLRKIVIPDLKAMMGGAKRGGVELKVISAYRSYKDQERIYNSWVAKLGTEEATKESAPPGCSQHELGTAVDFNDLSFSFANITAGIWLSENAWKYGWIISYPLNSENITGYVYEPWHYRYIGIDNALEMKKSGLILSQFLDTKNNF
jgi:D-alanyl-D-alanine carboxypeptidase